MKSILGVFVAAVALAACGNSPSDVCAQNAGYCRHVTDGGCVFMKPLCCSGSSPHCGDGAELVPTSTSGCTVVDEFSHGIGCL